MQYFYTLPLLLIQTKNTLPRDIAKIYLKNKQSIKNKQGAFKYFIHKENIYKYQKIH